MISSVSKKLSIDEYHSIAKDVSKKLDNYLLAEFRKRKDADLLLFMYKKFIEKKTGKEHQRPMMVYIASQLFEVKTDKEYKNLLPLMAVTELAIWSAYALNWVTDGKNQNPKNPHEVMIDLVASQYLWTEILYFNLPDHILRSFVEFFRKMMRSYILVETDLTITNYSNLENEKEFWKLYNIHGTQGTGVLYSYCFQIVQQYFDLKISQDKMLRLDGMMQVFGRNLQIINDASDLMVPNLNLTTTEKRAVKDYFIDIRTNRLTYPIWLLLNATKKDDIKLHKDIIQSAKERVYKDKFIERVVEYIKKTQIMNEIYNFLRYEEKRMKKEIDKLKMENRGADLLKILSLIYSHNKFLDQIRKDYNF